MRIKQSLQCIARSEATYRTICGLLGGFATLFGYVHFIRQIAENRNSFGRRTECISSTTVCLVLYVALILGKDLRRFNRKITCMLNFICSISGIMFATYMGSQLQDHEPDGLISIGGGLMLLSYALGRKYDGSFVSYDYGAPAMLIALATAQLMKQGTRFWIYVEIFFTACIPASKDIVVPLLTHFCALQPVTVNNEYVEWAYERPGRLLNNHDDRKLKLDAAVSVLEQRRLEWHTIRASLQNQGQVDKEEFINCVSTAVQQHQRLQLNVEEEKRSSAEFESAVNAVASQLKSEKMRYDSLHSDLKNREEVFTSLLEVANEKFATLLESKNKMEVVKEKLASLLESEKERSALLESEIITEMDRYACLLSRFEDDMVTAEEKNVRYLAAELRKRRRDLWNYCLRVSFTDRLVECNSG